MRIVLLQVFTHKFQFCLLIGKFPFECAFLKEYAFRILNCVGNSQRLAQKKYYLGTVWGVWGIHTFRFKWSLNWIFLHVTFLFHDNDKLICLLFTYRWYHIFSNRFIENCWEVWACLNLFHSIVIIMRGNLSWTTEIVNQSLENIDESLIGNKNVFGLEENKIVGHILEDRHKT